MQKIPGFILSIAVAMASYEIAYLPFKPFTIAGTASHPIEPMLVAILLGILIKNSFPLPKIFQAGISFAAKQILPIAIVLLGARLNIFNVLKISFHALVINIICVIVALVLTIWLCRRAKIDEKLALLIGIGTAICGSTAIIVTAPIVKANEHQTAMAVTIITLFGLLAIFLYPMLGHLLHLGQWAFGVWAGTAIQAIPQVVAAGFAYGQQAGDVATIVKLVRILLLAPMLVGLTIWQARQQHRHANLEKIEKVKWSNYVPPFIIGFIIVVILSSLGLFHDIYLLNWHIATLKWINEFAGILITIAMAGLGLSTNLRSFLAMGIKPLLMGFVSAAILGILSLILIKLAY